MKPGRSRLQLFLGLSVLGIGLIFAFAGGLHVFMTMTATPLHPAPADVPSVTGSSPKAEWSGAVEHARTRVLERLVEQSLPGMSVAVGVGDELVWAEGFGWADLDLQTRVEPDTRFRIGTASIALTSAGVGLLAQEGRLSLDENIRAYVPEFPEKPWPVTVRQLMAHQSGIRNDGGDEGPFDEHCGRAADGLRLFADRDLLFEPGTRYRFSSFGWVLVSAAVESVSGQSFNDFMRERVFRPAGMTDTRPEEADESVANRAVSYFPRYAADPKYGLHATRPVDFSCFAGAMVFVSTAPDLVRFGLAVNNGSLLTPEMVARLQAMQSLTAGAETGQQTGYGLGWDHERVTVNGQEKGWVGHSGTMLGGMVVTLMIFPEDDVVVAVLSNIAYAETEALAVQIAEGFLRR